MRFTKLAPIALITLSCAACSTVAQKTNMLSDADLATKSAEVIGVPASSLTLLDRHTDGTNTYADFRAANGAQYHCLINGGNLLSFGMTNPPICSKAGTPIQAGPFGGSPTSPAGGQTAAAQAEAAPAPAVAATMSLRAAQSRLDALGFDAGAADGQMGPHTRAALQAFQRARGLPPTGTLDARTVAVLENGR
jgi:hypothetical protein